MNISFSKMHGTGNDFVVIDNRHSILEEDHLHEKVPFLCDRKFGIGADGVLLIQADQTVDYRMVYKNADGSDAGMCGNGGRCIALFAKSLGFGTEQQFVVNNSVYRASIRDDGIIIYFPVEPGINRLEGPAGEKLFQIYPGTEHVVMQAGNDLLEDDARLFKLGRQLRYHPIFNPAGTNVNFFNVMGSNRIRVRTYERGVENLTLACGTGAIASAVTAHHHVRNQAPEGRYIVECEGGTLEVGFIFNDINETYSQIKLKGPAQFVFEGTIDI